jgi:hypothetical protein
MIGDLGFEFQRTDRERDLLLPGYTPAVEPIQPRNGGCFDRDKAAKGVKLIAALSNRNTTRLNGEIRTRISRIYVFGVTAVSTRPAL